MVEQAINRSLLVILNLKMDLYVDNMKDENLSAPKIAKLTVLLVYIYK